MKVPSYKKNKPSKKQTQKASFTISSKKPSPPPLTFEAKPGLNFVFGHNLISTPSQYTRHPIPRLSNTTKNETAKVTTIDLSEFAVTKPAATTELKDSPKEADKSKNDSGNESEEYIEINMGTDSESSGNELNENDLDTVKRHLNEKAETQKSTFSLKTTEPTERGDVSTLKQRQLEEFIDKLQNDIAQYKNTVEESNKTLRIMSEELGLAKEKYIIEIDSLKSKVYGEETFLKKCVPRVLQQLVENKNQLKIFLGLVKENAKIAENPALLDQDRLTKYQLTANYAAQLSQKVNLPKIDAIINELKQLFPPTHPYSEVVAGNKYEQQLIRIKAENSLLSSQAAELEKLMSMMQQANYPDFELKDHLKQEKNEIAIRAENVTQKHDNSTKIARLAKILSFVSKQRKNLQSIELRDALDKEKIEWEKYKIEIEGKLAATEESNNRTEEENKNLTRKTAELLELIETKDSQIRILKQESILEQEKIERLQQRFEKLAKDSHSRDALFADKMKEMRSMFEEIHREKEGKQKEIFVLMQRKAELDAIIMQKHQENELLKEKLSKKIILESAKKANLLFQTEPQFINMKSEENARELLEEIGRLDQERKIIREEVKKKVYEKELPKNILNNLMVNLAFKIVIGK